MPVTRIAIRDGKSGEYKQALLDGIYEAIRETVAIKDGDRFMAITEHGEHEFAYGAFLGTDRSDELVQIQIGDRDRRGELVVRQRRSAVLQSSVEQPSPSPQTPAAGADLRDCYFGAAPTSREDSTVQVPAGPVVISDAASQKLGTNWLVMNWFRARAWMVMSILFVGT
jgi:hypothetical protein